jgi:molybdopterin synthase catalytic subunit
MSSPLFVLSIQPLKATPPFAIDTHVGAIASFAGIVRDNNEGKSVVRLAYSAYQALAEREGTSIVREAIERFDLIAAACCHRVGELELGEVAVRVWAAAAHRGAAFSACEFIIDEIKERVPIWKKETYRDGEQEWVHCRHP